jgi:MoxR-like ATPase
LSASPDPASGQAQTENAAPKSSAALSASDAIVLINDTIDEISKYYVGDRATLSKIIAAVMAGGHVLLEDYPGIGKTFVAKLIAGVLGLSYKRIQFTPDLLPSDIAGTKIWRPAKGEFELMKGPIFANLILADEINRAPPKTQSALLEAMEEGQVTIEGETIELPAPFVVIATQNPIEFEGTYPLPEAQLDRFIVRLSLGYPEHELELLKRRVEWQRDDPSDQAMQILDSKKIFAIRALLESSVKAREEILQYIIKFASIRKDPRVLAGPSPRGLISLFRMSRAMALLSERDFIIPDDVKDVAVAVLSHRIVIKPEFALEDLNIASLVREYVAKIEVPK